MLSAASYRKVHEGWQTRSHGVWVGWMKYLQQTTSRWPGEERWNDLRFQGMTDLGNQSNDQVGVVYADGNAMGEVVQALDSLETCRQFSRIVDESIREACFAGVAGICQAEIEGVSQAIEKDRDLPPLPADILLLGGDDLLVAVPADRALDFALHVTVEFERLTREKVAALKEQDARQFFSEHVRDRGFTISCGVAIARNTFPFYLSLDLAEQLLKSAKRRDSDGTRGPEVSARIDFHVVAGTNSYNLEEMRKDDYHASTDAPAPRTLRPFSCSQLRSLRAGIQDLRQAGFPRSKLHELRDAALSETEQQAERGIRDVFARCRHGAERSERRALWSAVSRLCPSGYEFDFPWFRNGQRRLLCVADIVDAYDLFGN